MPTEIIVSAAASLTDALPRIGAEWTRAERGASMARFNFGASGALVAQIAAGAPADVFVAAGRAEMDTLEKVGKIERASRLTFATNRLVLIAHGVPELRDWAGLRLPAVRRIALANPESVPAGRYGRQTLQHRGVWDAVQAKLVMGENVRQVLTYVVSGDADAGIVFATDARVARGKVRVVATALPGRDHDPVVYPVAVVAGSTQADIARRFVRFLAQPPAQKLLRAAGFAPAGA